MAWFINHYRCDRCHEVWADEWSCMCDDDCPHCGFRHMTPFESEHLTTLIAPNRDAFIVLRSPDTAEHDPDYRERPFSDAHDGGSCDRFSRAILTFRTN